MKPLILIVMDGWGLSRKKRGNAVKLANTPNYNSFLRRYPNTILEASGEAVGLPKGTLGGSEVGHMNIGAGRIVYQELEMINDAIKNMAFFRNQVFIRAVKKAKEGGSRLHIMGLVSDKGVHSHINHLFALLGLASKYGVEVLVHFFSDGRDSPPKSAMKYLNALNKRMEAYKTGKVATLIGRYYAMDRDNRWERTKKAYDALVYAKGRKLNSAEDAIKDAYKAGETDEFIKPRIIGAYSGVKDGDCIINFDYRTDRERQLTHAFVDKNFRRFKVNKLNMTFVCMTEYYGGVPTPVAFKTPRIKHSFGEVISKKGLKQLRIAESEKYAHVTFFFNGQVEKPYRNEDRIIVSSPRVATYDLKPEMSAYEVTSKVIKSIKSGRYAVIILNFANPDMVGHTGSLKAAIRAVEAVDECVGKVVKEIRRQRGTAIITADHGNCEEMTGKYRTSHTMNPVPFIVVSDKRCRLRKGVLADISPTMLELMDIKKPKEMTSKGLLQKQRQKH